jgi:nucleoside-diphosphate-sugar epimerase
MILVTGATGFLGSYLIPYLAKKMGPSEIMCLVPNQETVRMAGGRIREDALIEQYRAMGVAIRFYPAYGTIEEYRASLRDLESISHVIYMAANNNQTMGFAKLYEDNVEMFDRFIDALGDRLRGVPFIFTSSVMADASEKIERRFGTRSIKKLLPYGKSKRLAEHLLLKKSEQYHFPARIFRLGSVYGDKAATGLLKFVDGLLGLAQIVPVPFFPGRASVIHVVDVVLLLAEAIASDIPVGVYHADDAAPVAVGALVHQAAAKIGKTSRQFRMPKFFIAGARFVLVLGIRLGLPLALGLMALVDDIYVVDDTRIWKIIHKKPRPFAGVIPALREALAERNGLRREKVALLGASGFIGGRILRQLLHEGFRVRCGVHRVGFGDDIGDAFECVSCDTSDSDSLKSFFRGQDMVLYAAGLTTAQGEHSWGEYLKANARDVVNVAVACKEAGIKKLIFLGSQASHKHAVGRYGVSKYLGEKIVSFSDTPWVILKPGQVIGTKGLVNTLYALSTLLPIFPVPAGTPKNLELVGVDDLAAFIVTLMEDQGGIYERKIIYCGSEKRLSLEELLSLLWKRRGKRPLVFHVPRLLLLLGARMAHLVGIRIPLTAQVLEGIYTPLPVMPHTENIVRSCNEDPMAVLDKYL